jgi:hypothetical protein
MDADGFRLDMITPSEALLAALQMEGFRAGDHAIPHERGWPAVRFWVTKSWYARIIFGTCRGPSILCARAQYTKGDAEGSWWHRAAVEMPWLRNGVPYTDTACIDLDDDPVELAAGSMPLFFHREPPPAVSDGIAYSLALRTDGFRADLRFGNPKDTHLRQLAGAIYSVLDTLPEPIRERLKGAGFLV